MITDEWCVLVNPNAGIKGISASDVAGAFQRLGVGATVTTTVSPDHLRAIVTSEIGRGTRRFAVVGGDGTAHFAVNAMMDSNSDASERFVLGIIAAGSGSDFVRTFGHTRNLEAAVARLRVADLYSVDIGLVDGTFGERYFLNAVNVGVAAASAERASSFPRRMGSLRYVVGFWVALAGFPPASISVNVGRHTFQGDAISVVAANGQFFGGGMNVAPRASPADGLFDVQVFAGPRRSAFSVMPRVVRGTHLSHAGVRRYIGSDVHIMVPGDWPVEADGEILGSGAVSVRMNESAIDFVA